MESNTDHLTLCSEKRLRELLQKESELARLSNPGRTQFCSACNEAGKEIDRLRRENAELQSKIVVMAAELAFDQQQAKEAGAASMSLMLLDGSFGLNPRSLAERKQEHEIHMTEWRNRELEEPKK